MMATAHDAVVNSQMRAISMVTFFRPNFANPSFGCVTNVHASSLYEVRPHQPHSACDLSALRRFLLSELVSPEPHRPYHLLFDGTLKLAAAAVTSPEPGSAPSRRRSVAVEAACARKYSISRLSPLTNRRSWG